MDLSIVLCKLKVIGTLIENSKSLGKRELCHLTGEKLATISLAIEDLNDHELLKIIKGKYTLNLDSEEKEDMLIVELVIDILERYQALSPRDLADCVKDITGDRFGEQRILDIAKIMALNRIENVRIKSVGIMGRKERRTFYYLVQYTENLGKIYRIYRVPKLRHDLRLRIHSKEPIEEASLLETIVEGPESKPDNYLEFIKHLQTNSNYDNQIVHIKLVEKKNPQFGALKNPMPAEILGILEKEKKYPLYTHQVAAINALRGGENIVIDTPNASGKTLCYSIPMFERMIENPSSRALYITPTKALAQDQLKRFKKFNNTLSLNTNPATYDGDTPKEPKKIRENIRKKSHIILTNPDELHYGILPYHTEWENFFRNLVFVIIDEVHIYTGVFGSHVANVLRRLRRLCNYYGANPQFVCVSATIANPKEFADKLVGLKFKLINNNGAPTWPKYFVFWNPPLTEANERKSPYGEAVFLFKEHVKHGINNITFTMARKIAELILRRAKEDLCQSLWPKIKSYRAGYTPVERREIERGLLVGELIGVTATNALELGIDIGDLDATILVGYPGSIASTWQQANRAGRRDKESLVTMIALDDPLNQYIITHSEEFFEKPHESALINPCNIYILSDHIPCAASELPIAESENIFDMKISALCDVLEANKILQKKNDHWYSNLKYPHQKIHIRGATSSADRFGIIDISKTHNKIIGDCDGVRAYKELHQGAVYLHQGETYYVRELDLNKKLAYVQPMDVEYYTEPLRYVDIKIINTIKTKTINEIEVSIGEIKVREQVIGFVEIRDKKGEARTVIGKEDLYLPPITLKTYGCWIKFSEKVKIEICNRGINFEGGIHAIEHTIASMLPIYAICDRRDINSVSYINHSDLGGSVIFIYDNAPGGVGLTEEGFRSIDKILPIVFETIKNCKCKEGCPSCIQSPFCERRNENIDKYAALKILNKILARTTPENEIKNR